MDSANLGSKQHWGWYTFQAGSMHPKASCSLHMISCTRRSPRMKLPFMHSRHLGQLRVLCVHSMLSREQQISYLSVMPIRDQLRLQLRFLTCHKHIAAVREIRQLTEAIKYQKYPTVLYLVTMNYSDDNRPKIVWKIPDTISDELNTSCPNCL